VRIDTLQSILVTVDDFLMAQPEMAGLFFRVAQAKGDAAFPFTPFVRLLSKDDEYIQLKAAKILAFLLVEAELSPPYDPSEFVGWILKQLGNANQSVSDIAIQLLQSLLSIPAYKVYFYFKTTGPSL
jgi:V-type H+-transporting ATPase subunit H